MIRKIRSLTLAARLALTFVIIILIFLSVFVHIGLAYSEVAEYQRFRADFVWTRAEYLLEYHTNFMRLRLVLSDTYFSETWLMLADFVDWENAGLNLIQMREDFRYRSQAYMNLVQADYILTDAEQMSRLRIKQNIRDQVESIFVLVFDEQFAAALRSREESFESLRSEVRNQTELIAISVENNLQSLQTMAAQIDIATEQHIDETVTNIIIVVIIVAATALGLSALFAIMVVKGVRNMDVEKSLEALRRKAVEEESKAKTKFLARMSHEIRTPLNAVLGVTEIEMLKDDHPPQTEEAFLRIYNSSSLLLAIINDILDLSKVESGKMEIINAVYETASLIVDTVQLNLMHVGSKQLAFKLKVDETIPSYLVGDELRIKQILNNILSNAFKYTKEGYVYLSISKKETQMGIYINFRVEDTGIGMTEEQVNRLFVGDYTRFNIVSNRAIEGSGLGMNIAHQLVTMMDGNIYVDSRPGRGTTITVSLPQVANDDRMIGKEVVENLENLEVSQRGMRRISRFKRTPMPYGRVLVVDDVESNLFVAKGLLLPYKLSVETATSGPAAIGKVRSGEIYDIIFMDHMMPEMDGIEAVKIIRETGYDYPIVALTANTVVGQSDIFMDNGFDGFVSKPIDVNLLNNYLVRFIHDRHPTGAAEVAQAAGVAEPIMANNAWAGKLTEKNKKAFLRDANRAMVNISPIALEQPLDAEAIRKYITSIHGMKSALAIMGEAELSQMSGELEKAAKVILEKTLIYLEQMEEVIERVTAETGES